MGSDSSASSVVVPCSAALAAESKNIALFKSSDVGRTAVHAAIDGVAVAPASLLLDSCRRQASATQAVHTSAALTSRHYHQATLSYQVQHPQRHGKQPVEPAVAVDCGERGVTVPGRL